MLHREAANFSRLLLKSGKQLKVSFQNLAKETIAIPMPLNDFATVYDKIK